MISIKCRGSIPRGYLRSDPKIEGSTEEIYERQRIKKFGSFIKLDLNASRQSPEFLKVLYKFLPDLI